MIINSVNPVAFTILNTPIYWYGIIMAIAIFVAISLANKLLNDTNAQKDIIINTSPYLILSGIMGARFYFCLLTPIYYLFNPLEIFNIRQGGLSIHGAIIVGLIALTFIAKRYKIPTFKMLDVVSLSTLLGQSIGRWGNYFNSEAYGLPTNQTWGLFIPITRRLQEYIDINLYHPTFLYESILDFIGFILLCFIYKYSKNKYNGLTFFSYLTIYGLIRFFIERIRIDSALYISTIPIAQIVSTILIFIGITGVICSFRKSIKIS